MDRLAVSTDILAFLMGTGELEGCHFGDKHPTRKGNFWWRTLLRESLALSQPTDSSVATRLRTEFLPGILHGDERHRAWLTEAVDCFLTDRPLPPPTVSAPTDSSPAGEVVRLRNDPAIKALVGTIAGLSDRPNRRAVAITYTAGHWREIKDALTIKQQVKPCGQKGE